MLKEETNSKRKERVHYFIGLMIINFNYLQVIYSNTFKKLEYDLKKHDEEYKKILIKRMTTDEEH